MVVLVGLVAPVDLAALVEMVTGNALWVEIIIMLDDQTIRQNGKNVANVVTNEIFRDYHQLKVFLMKIHHVIQNY
jgi:hypothetical protein